MITKELLRQVTSFRQLPDGPLRNHGVHRGAGSGFRTEGACLHRVRRPGQLETRAREKTDSRPERHRESHGQPLGALCTATYAKPD